MNHRTQDTVSVRETSNDLVREIPGLKGQQTGKQLNEKYHISLIDDEF